MGAGVFQPDSLLLFLYVLALIHAVVLPVWRLAPPGLQVTLPGGSRSSGRSLNQALSRLHYVASFRSSPLRMLQTSNKQRHVRGVITIRDRSLKQRLVGVVTLGNQYLYRSAGTATIPSTGASLISHLGGQRSRHAVFSKAVYFAIFDTAVGGSRISASVLRSHHRRLLGHLLSCLHIKCFTHRRPA